MLLSGAQPRPTPLRRKDMVDPFCTRGLRNPVDLQRDEEPAGNKESVQVLERSVKLRCEAEGLSFDNEIVRVRREASLFRDGVNVERRLSHIG